jgi:hypothetical protein
MKFGLFANSCLRVTTAHLTILTPGSSRPQLGSRLEGREDFTPTKEQGGDNVSSHELDG